MKFYSYFDEKTHGYMYIFVEVCVCGVGGGGGAGQITASFTCGPAYEILIHFAYSEMPLINAHTDI